MTLVDVEPSIEQAKVVIGGLFARRGDTTMAIESMPGLIHADEVHQLDRMTVSPIGRLEPAALCQSEYAHESERTH